jgi:urease accessory protein
VDGAVLVRIYENASLSHLKGINYWNNWISAQRETEELRKQSWQMGEALYKLLPKISSHPLLQEIKLVHCNFITAFGLAAFCWDISLEEAVLVYFHSWLTNLISASVKAIPLGQTLGQQLTWAFQDELQAITQESLSLTDEKLESCSIGLSLASMQHEVQYTRLFRS